ncbi:YecH family metal-binding protein [Cerasicoccus frondis]|uniref:YecH family metal-binding protein n=1 Tax=Cerasicoccus frondis TaxID=490090 RepID=UPI0028525868|nr:YecH family metal-binding protein [Cerasicoccus frondis]
MTQHSTDEIHGHAVLQMMDESGLTYSRASLLAAINEKFGKDARFGICSGGNLTASELIEELAAKGKFIGEPDAFKFDPSAMCNH